MKFSKCIIVGLLTVSMCGVVAPSVSGVIVSADEVHNGNTYLPPVKESDYLGQKTERSIWSKIAKSAIKKAIRNKHLLMEFIEEVAGKTVARNANKFFSPIAASLEPLLEWAEIPGNAVYDAVFRAVIKAGGSRAVAANIANAIREVLEWTLF
ncbi:TPA: hypothetical protein U0J94_002321 [Streptococcus suis]|uniref:Uncharacterized protein n=4 Tax=Streptococcus suis TaxID=1307 RepID=A0A2H4I6Z7_STRSU|nr:hypothetical protein [Streptococcus suis]ARS43210.1 hypothetical protein [Streptococcus suis]MCB2884346.1 hypothetical protein [Streptococcus suis]MCB2909114.1 hypothetical protein [Streptococcus suis]MCB2911231.1 hypothetical protein [Streptococcus suis]MCB2913299.1 hypothetical protein [Streptococcus suis]